MPRVNFEPITGADLSNVGDEEIKGLIASYEKHSGFEHLSESERARSASVLSALVQEKQFRDDLKAVGCSFLRHDGTCRDAEVTQRHGEDHACPRLQEGTCTKRQLELSNRLLRRVC